MFQKKIKQLLNRIAIEKEGKLENAFFELSGIVKKHEGEDFLQSVEDALPQLAKFLLYDERYAVTGCTLSIFRRVDINSATIVKLIELNRNDVNGDVIHALGLIDAEFWNEEVEAEIVKGLSVEKAAYLAATALYQNHHHILNIDTLGALEQAAKRQDYLTAQLALTTLCCLTKFIHGNIALEKLSDLLNLPDQRKRREIAEVLGWGTNKGFQLLKTLASDKNAEVRLAVAKAIIRTYMNEDEAMTILKILENDEDKDVRDAAINTN